MLKLKNMLVTKNIIGFLAIGAVLFSCKKTTTADMSRRSRCEIFYKYHQHLEMPRRIHLIYSAVNVPIACSGFWSDEPCLCQYSFSQLNSRYLHQAPVSAGCYHPGGQLDTSLIAKYNAAVIVPVTFHFL
jgi:hypothetical protein